MKQHRLNIRLSEEQKRNFKEVAAKKGKTMTAIIDECINRLINSELKRV